MNGSVRLGQGFDVHRLVPDRPLRLGGIRVPYERGLAGHSDGDVLLHAIASALLGAIGAGDLGAHFPSSDASLEGIASTELLGRVVSRVATAGYTTAQVDATVIAEAPRLEAFRAEMEKSIAATLSIPPERVNVKITSTDGLGALGRGEGVAALAVALLEREDGA